MQNPLNVLHLEDNRLDAELIRETLTAQGIVTNISPAQTEDEFRSSLQRENISLVLAEYAVPGFDGMTALAIARENWPDLPFIFVSRTIGEESAIESLKHGANDYVLKQSLQGLGLSVRRAMSEVEERAEQRQTDLALKASELNYRRLFESAKDGILILDADSGQIADVNPYLIEMLAYSKEELVGKELWQIGSFKDIAASRAGFVELQQRGYIRYRDLPLETRHGQVRQVEFVSTSYQVGESQVIQCNIRDITDDKQAERELRKSNLRLEQTLEELRSKSEALASTTQQLWQASKLATVGELAASIAHELNNPLATVALRAESLLIDLPIEGAQAHALDVILCEVERMATLVSNLLNFSRRRSQQISSLDLRDELRNSLDFIRYHLRGHKIDIVQDFADDFATIQADRQQLQQMFLNLLTNASDAMPEGGTLTVRAFSGTLDDGAKAIVAEFSDTGIGIEEEDLPKLWEPFFTTKPEGKGTGLGLPICRRTVEEHRGTISINSLPGQGTTVRIKLPATGNGETANAA